MRDEDLKSLFDQQAATYDTQWARMAPIRDALHFLLEAVLSGLPDDARVLCVGVGTGAEMAHLAKVFPRWRFTALDPSGAMIEVCRQRAQTEGFASRCEFHVGYLDSLPESPPHHAATCFLVSQFILDRDARVAFFRAIAARLQPGAILASSDLASDTDAATYEPLLALWMKTMSRADVSAERLERMRHAYANDVAVLPPASIASIIGDAGFELPTLFHQAGLIHAWFSRRAA